MALTASELLEVSFDMMSKVTDEDLKHVGVILIWSKVFKAKWGTILAVAEKGRKAPSEKLCPKLVGMDSMH